MAKYRIAALPGDGIGPEVMEASLRVLHAAVAKVPGLEIEVTPHVAGAGLYRRTGEMLPPAVLEDCLAADAVFLAAIGLPDVRQPDGTEVQPIMMMGLRRALNVYAAVRPIKLYPGVNSPLKNTERGIDFVIMRENLEGLFASYGGGVLLNNEVATDTLVVTRTGTERIVRFAFELSQRRKGRPLDGRKLVTCVDKANFFRTFAFFRQIFGEVAQSYPEIATEAQYVDAASMLMIQRPEAYDVVVTENQFGDILSDLGAGLVGGLGMAPTAELGDRYGLFQPTHGSAPDIAGRGIANPLATILTAGMLLDWLGHKHGDSTALRGAELIESAVTEMLANGGPRTRDLGGTASTNEVATAVEQCLKN